MRDSEEKMGIVKFSQEKYDKAMRQKFEEEADMCLLM